MCRCKPPQLPYKISSGTHGLLSLRLGVYRCHLPDTRSIHHALVKRWRNVRDERNERCEKCSTMHQSISPKSTQSRDVLEEAPGMEVFRPEADVGIGDFSGRVDKERLLSILDVNSVLEDAISAKVLGRNADYQGVGLWILASFINHSCEPNVRRVHVGDYMVVHASRDVKAGEELTMAYFDVLAPREKRREMADNWGFVCGCKRCLFEDGVCFKNEMREMEMAMGKGVVDVGGLVYRLEEGMRRWMVRGRGKGYLRASFWEAYEKVFGSEKVMRKWGRKIPGPEAVVDSIVHAAGSDERVVRVLVEGLRRGGRGGNGVVEMEMEKVIKLGRGVYGKMMKKQAIGALIQLYGQE
ncbi:hypothetical protein SASPL_143903 [Salvia splendens]|uniref:SET domain-containing protein n=1 Tax=Salvia splendens TaxID=180675 RepID=A0A8X8WMG6_SALSN|nr:hypothetical protein SASPL_143903 [Salvia splendens]